jgi:hypothetical protein
MFVEKNVVSKTGVAEPRLFTHFKTPNYLVPSPNTTYVKVKVKNVQFTLEQATKAQRGSRGVALLFL